jgi:glycosyltransferase involved in cell wall biosynthesis
MNFGLVGWGIASGNGGMNHDICSLSSWVTHWLIPEHPKSKNHAEYIDHLAGKNIIHCKLHGDEDKYNKFLDEINGLIYVEHPCLKEEYDIVLEAKKRDILVVGIPMWEWWPERKPWAFKTDILWSVTEFTNSYLKSLSNVLYTHGWEHNWRGNVMGDKWGVNLNDFPYRERAKAERLVFIYGNGGYKDRKASSLVLDAFSKPNSPDLTIYSQGQDIQITTPNIRLINKNFPNRSDVYADGDVFLFPSYWEGLCHGLYEAQASGGAVITTDHVPMNECGTDYLIPVVNFLQEDLSGKKIMKAVGSSMYLNKLCADLKGRDIKNISKNGRERILKHYDLESNLAKLYDSLLHQKMLIELT